MVRLVNRLTGTDMYVEESRLDEYLGQGHTLPSVPTTEDKPKTAKPKVEPKKTTSKKK